MRARGLRATRWGERGQALAEFALVLPLMLLFIAGIVELGRAWNIKQVVTDAAREGARYAVADTAMNRADVIAKVEQRLELARIQTSAISVVCGGLVPETRVTVSTDVKLGLVGALLGWAGAPSVVPVSSRTIMRNERPDCAI